jgi:hypothetical protein
VSHGNTNDIRELDNIDKYCKENHYDLIWFCHDVEEVYLGRKAPDSQKVQEAAAFRRKKQIEKLQSGKLSCDGKHVCTSNILNVLDKYLSRKE